MNCPYGFFVELLSVALVRKGRPFFICFMVNRRMLCYNIV